MNHQTPPLASAPAAAAPATQMFAVFADCAKNNFTRMQACAVSANRFPHQFLMRTQAGDVEKAVSFCGGTQAASGRQVRRLLRSCRPVR